MDDDVLRKIGIVDGIRKNIVTFTNIDDLERASEIARRWFKS